MQDIGIEESCFGDVSVCLDRSFNKGKDFEKDPIGLKIAYRSIKSGVHLRLFVNKLLRPVCFRRSSPSTNSVS